MSDSKLATDGEQATTMLLGMDSLHSICYINWYQMKTKRVETDFVLFSLINKQMRMCTACYYSLMLVDTGDKVCGPVTVARCTATRRLQLKTTTSVWLGRDHHTITWRRNAGDMTGSWDGCREIIGLIRSPSEVTCGWIYGYGLETCWTVYDHVTNDLLISNQSVGPGRLRGRGWWLGAGGWAPW